MNSLFVPSLMFSISLLSVCNANQIFRDNSAHRMVTMFQDIQGDFRCRIYGHRDAILRALRETESQVITLVSRVFLDSLITNCSTSELTRITRGIIDYDDIKIIFPGTKWCGWGNISRDGIEIGNMEKEDLCCKEHDSCPQYIIPGETLFGITNTQISTLLRCDCEKAFIECLRGCNSNLANTFGNIYYNIRKPQCFQMEHPSTGCVKYIRKNGKKRCTEYTFDRFKRRRYQLFDAPIYQGIEKKKRRKRKPKQKF